VTGWVGLDGAEVVETVVGGGVTTGAGVGAGTGVWVTEKVLGSLVAGATGAGAGVEQLLAAKITPDKSRKSDKNFFIESMINY
jgi:predicted phage tail protein